MAEENERTGQAAEEDLLGPLRAVLEALPEELPPRRDLLPEIAARAWRGEERPGIEGILHFWRVSRAVRMQLAAAASVLVIVTALVTYLALGGTQPGEGAGERTAEVAGGGASPAVLVGARSAGLESRYAEAIGDLLEALGDQSSRLSPETRDLIERNLRVIDAALEEARSALTRKPDDPALRRALVGSYERKLGFLRQVSALTAES